MSVDNSFYRRLGKKIRQQREKKKFSQEHLSLFCKIDRTYIARIEEGKANPTVKILNKISRALEIRLWQLLRGL
ncbi:MAG: helix-turn-helix domain-containing protein [Microgenomates group bacterium]